jgi:hypothetical protein
MWMTSQRQESSFLKPVRMPSYYQMLQWNILRSLGHLMMFKCHEHAIFLWINWIKTFPTSTNIIRWSVDSYFSLCVIWWRHHHRTFFFFFFSQLISCDVVSIFFLKKKMFFHTYTHIFIMYTKWHFTLEKVQFLDNTTLEAKMSYSTSYDSRIIWHFLTRPNVSY